MTQEEKDLEKSGKRQKFIIDALLKDQRAKSLSDNTLLSIAKTMEPFFTSIEETYQDQYRKRDRLWEHALKINSIRKGKIEKVMFTLNKLWKL